MANTHYAIAGGETGRERVCVVARIVEALFVAARDDRTVLGPPRIIQARARKGR